MSDAMLQRGWIFVWCTLVAGVALIIWPEQHVIIGGATMLVGAFWLGFEIGLQCLRRK